MFIVEKENVLKEEKMKQEQIERKNSVIETIRTKMRSLEGAMYLSDADQLELLILQAWFDLLHEVEQLEASLITLVRESVENFLTRANGLLKIGIEIFDSVFNKVKEFLGL